MVYLDYRKCVGRQCTDPTVVFRRNPKGQVATITVRWAKLSKDLGDHAVTVPEF